MSFELTPSPNVYKGTKADLAASSRNYKAYDILQISDDPGQFYFGGQPDQTPKDLLPFQTAVKKHTGLAVNVTATLTAAQSRSGLLTSTSAAAVTITTLTAALWLAALKAAAGTWFDFAIDNSAGANTVTLVGGTGVTAATAVITGGATLTTAAGAVGMFRLYFSSATVAKIYRIG